MPLVLEHPEEKKRDERRDGDEQVERKNHGYAPFTRR